MGRLIARDVPGGRFDSTLYTAGAGEHHNADLVLKVRIRVVALPLEAGPGATGLVARDYNQTAHPAVELTDSDLSSVFATIKRKTEKIWNTQHGHQAQLWLVPDPPLEFYHVLSRDRTRAFCPFIRCRLLIQPAEGARPHLTVKVAKRVSPTAPFRSSAGGPDNARYMTLDDGDLDLDGDNSENRYTVPHELGHHIGLSHVHNSTQACLEHPPGDDGACYGRDFTWSNTNIMGGNRADGMRVEAWNSWPWRNRMNQHWDIGHDWTRELPPERSHEHTRDHYHSPPGRPRPRVVSFYRADTRNNDPVAGVNRPDGGV